MLVLSLMASNGCPPALLLYKEQGISRPFQDLQHLMPTLGSRQEITRSSILTLMPNEQDDPFQYASALHEYKEFVKMRSLRRMPLPFDVQEMHADRILFGYGIDEQWTKHKQMLQYLVSGSSGMKEDYLDPAILPQFMVLPALPSDMHLHHVPSTEFEFYGEKGSLLHLNGNYYDQEIDGDLVHDLPPNMSFQSDGQPSFVGTMTDMKDLISVLEEFSLRKDSARWRTQKVLVPHFRWNDAIELQDHVYTSSLKLKAVTAAPLKSPEKVKLKPAPKRKNRKATKERDRYRTNSVHACESLLSLMMDKNRNGKSVMDSLKKSGPELPQLLTQFSASIAGTGLAVIFSVLYKVACGSIHFSTANLLTSGFAVGLFWVSWAVNKLRDTTIYIRKNSAKLGFKEEEEMVLRVDKSVKDIFFRAAASMVVLMLRFA